MARPQFEDLALWFLRLNGFLTVDRYILHAPRGGARTDFDVIGVRFPYRRELAGRQEITDESRFMVEGERVQLVIAECKKGEGYRNPSQVDPAKETLRDILEALGVFPPEANKEAAQELGDTGEYERNGCIGRLCCMAGSFQASDPSIPPKSVRFTWDEILGFIHDRMATFEGVKRDHSQWPVLGRSLYDTAIGRFREDPRAFTEYWKGLPDVQSV